MRPLFGGDAGLRPDVTFHQRDSASDLLPFCCGSFAGGSKTAATRFHWSSLSETCFFLDAVEAVADGEMRHCRRFVGVAVEVVRTEVVEFCAQAEVASAIASPQEYATSSSPDPACRSMLA